MEEKGWRKKKGEIKGQGENIELEPKRLNDITSELWEHNLK